ncbi:MAG TPA: 3-oxoacyl-ACP reductase family protein [Mycobacterium sp.]|jgi:acetoacetyl-CoA reductase/3-oxoacyl-[acyl-carrier protein] reductase|nr:3-oxoacyl-ACP reductase family protein [Mycobacterium sp.]HTH85287.1 3-oxoacyl-ACP reductase family protein [Mycobacterium sp.]
MTTVLESQPRPSNPPATDKLAGRVAFVTGGTRGIGAAIAHSLASQGATVAVGYNRDRDSADQFVASLLPKTRPHGASASAHRGNVGSSGDCRRSIAEVIDEHGRLDILINNAGITIDKTVATMTDDDWHNVLAVNLSGAFFLCQAALAHMVERGSGRIVNVSSVVGETGNIGQANYAASKSGLFGLTKTLAKEAAYLLAKSGKRTDDGIGITVNTVTPGLITTEMTADIPEKVTAKLTSQIPVGRAGRPEEVARVVHFLAADASSYITGQVWSVNGGMDM